MTKLLKCPLCGGDANYVGTDMVRAPWNKIGLDAMGVTVVCKECGCTIPSSVSFDEADKAWNRRAVEYCKPTTLSELELDAENAKLREMALDLYCLAYPSTVEWEVSDAIYDKYSPCELCEKDHGGKSPCASTSKDLAEECCKPSQAKVVADRMRELGIEVDG